MYVMTIRADCRLVHFRMRDSLTVAQFRRAFLDFVESPDFHPHYLILTDAREVTELHADFKGIFNAVQGLAQVFAKFESAVPCIIIVKGDLHFGMARMLQQILEVFSNIRVHPVKEIAEASMISGLDLQELAEVLAQGDPTA
jgi:hypothetical protein